jgi:hypothetical protein
MQRGNQQRGQAFLVVAENNREPLDELFFSFLRRSSTNPAYRLARAARRMRVSRAAHPCDQCRERSSTQCI